MKWIIGILVVLMFAGCTGEKLAPGGTADIKFTFDATTGKISGASVTTNRDSTIGSLEFDMQKGTFKLVKYSGNGSSLAAIQAQAMVEQFKSYQATAAEAFKLAQAAAAGYLKASAPVTPAPAVPAAPLAKPTP